MIYSINSSPFAQGVYSGNQSHTSNYVTDTMGRSGRSASMNRAQSHGVSSLASKNDNYLTRGMEEFEDPKVRKLVEQSRRRFAQTQKSLSSTWNYADALAAARNKNQKTGLEVKQLQYNFKSISTKIIRSKTSSGAREAVFLARKELRHLKSLRGKEGYDSDELEAAIKHVKRMERVAKKKEKHLLEEEMIKASGGLCLGEISQNEDEEDEIESDESFEGDEELLNNEELLNSEQSSGSDSSQSTSTYQMADSELLSPKDFASKMDDLISDLSEEMKDLLDELGLDELTDEMDLEAEDDIDPADFKMMKIKHRNSEMKDMVKSDAEYLKDLFDIIDKQSGADSSAAALSSDTGAGFSALV